MVKKGATPKWVALVSGMDQNLRFHSWWFNFDPHPPNDGQSGFRRHTPRVDEQRDGCPIVKWEVLREPPRPCQITRSTFGRRSVAMKLPRVAFGAQLLPFEGMEGS